MEDYLDDAERYAEALLWLQGRMEWGMNDTVARYYNRAISRVIDDGLTWDDALAFEDEE